MLSSSISADPTIPVTKPFDGIDSASTSSADKSADKPIDNGTTPPSQSPPSISPVIESDNHASLDLDKSMDFGDGMKSIGKEEPKVEPVDRKGWETPPSEPINGVVQPRTIPPPGKPTRQTNLLDYLAKEVLKPALKHKHAWPFLKPVDALKLNIPDYHKVIKRPMDLGTIEKRLKNCYYTCAEECVNDIMTMFNNCFTYCPADYGVYGMAKKLESDILAKLSRMPADDFEQVFANCYKFNQNEDDVALMCKNVENVIRDKIRNMPSQEVEVSKQVPKKAGKVAKKTLAQRGTSVASNMGRGSVASSPHSSAPSETAAAVLEYFHNATIQVSRESSSVRDGEQVEKKAPKRKAESPLVFDEKPIRRDNPNSRYDALKYMDYSTLKPRYTGKLSSQMKFCGKIIQELVSSKKCKEFNWPFIEPVNDIDLNIPDYYVVIKRPMDIGTLKKKFDARQYANPAEIRDDLHLLCNNCFQYNPEGQAVNKMGKDLMKYFDERWKQMPKEPELLPDVPLTPISTTTSLRDPYAFPGTRTPAPTLPVQSTPIPHNQTYGPLTTDDAIDTLLEDVQSEQFRLTNRVGELQRYMQELVQLKQRRREAREQKAVAPSLSGELHTYIKRSLMSGGVTAPITPSPFSAIVTQSSFVSTPITQNPPASLMSPVAASANMFSAAANGAKRRAGRPKGSANLPKTPSIDMSMPLVSPVVQPPVLPPAPPALAQQPFNMVPIQEPVMPPPGQPPLPKSGRGRKPGSKNKPKGAREERPEYEFNSDDDQASEPMTYEEKRRLSTNINSLPSDRLSKVLAIIGKRESLNGDVNPEEVEIDFETLQPKTLRELESFVTQCGQRNARRQNAPRPLEQEARKRELEQRLAEMGGNSKRGMAGAPPRGRPPTNATSANRDSSESSSSSSSSSSESSSSDSSDSESEQKEPPKSSPRSNGTNNNASRQRSNVMVNKPTNNNTLNSAPGLNGLKTAEDKRNIIHSGAGPLLQNNNAVSHAGISGSVLDQLLPAAEASADNNTGVSKGNYLDSFDAFKRMKREKDMTKQSLAQRDQERSKNGTETSSTSKQDEIQRLKMAEKERRQRESANDEGITTQMDIMANFEDNF